MLCFTCELLHTPQVDPSCYRDVTHILVDPSCSGSGIYDRLSYDEVNNCFLVELVQNS